MNISSLLSSTSLTDLTRLHPSRYYAYLDGRIFGRIVRVKTGHHYICLVARSLVADGQTASQGRVHGHNSYTTSDDTQYSVHKVGGLWCSNMDRTVLVVQRVRH